MYTSGSFVKFFVFVPYRLCSQISFNESCCRNAQYSVISIKNDEGQACGRWTFNFCFKKLSTEKSLIQITNLISGQCDSVRRPTFAPIWHKLAQYIKEWPKVAQLIRNIPPKLCQIFLCGKRLMVFVIEDINFLLDRYISLEVCFVSSEYT